jgi:hypothetical protein
MYRAFKGINVESDITFWFFDVLVIVGEDGSNQAAIWVHPSCLSMNIAIEGGILQ